MYKGIKNSAKLHIIITKGKASFPIILDFNFFNNKKY